MRKNPKGRHAELWVHSHGCRRWFHVVRDTATNRILAVYRRNDEPGLWYADIDIQGGLSFPF